MAVYDNYASLDEGQLSFAAFGGWADLAEHDKNELRNAFGVVQSAFAATPELQKAIHTVAFYNATLLEEELMASKRHFAIDVAARMDEYTRGKLDALGDVASLLTQTNKQNDIISQMEIKEE